MPQPPFIKYIRLAETIRRVRKITFREINRKWLENDLSEGIELPKRTFHKWRIAVEELFGLVIECDRKDGYRFYIRYEEALYEGGARNRLFDLLSVSLQLEESKHLRDRILPENMPSGHVFLSAILDAMKKNRLLHIVYRSFRRETPNAFEIEPYCVKAFRQRWYLVAKSTGYEELRLYALDRIEALETTDRSFRYPANFSPEEFFRGCFGVIAGDGTDMERVELKVAAAQADYLRTLPLHESQEEIARTDEYGIFRYDLRPTFDFQQEILSYGEQAEVLRPAWLRKRMAEKAEQMRNRYKTDAENGESGGRDATDGLSAVAQDYACALDTLDKYDHQRLEISGTYSTHPFRATYENAMEAVRSLHERFGGSRLFGREKDESFHSVIDQIYQTFDGEELYPSVEEKAAILLYTAVKNHAFIDGNKRIAAMLFLWFMHRNGMLYRTDGNKRIAGNTLVALILMIAESRTEEKETIVKLAATLIDDKNV